MTAAEIVRLLDLKPHPEGGFYRETWRDTRLVEGGRAASSLIYFLLGTGDVSDWHRVDAAEVWHWYAGAPLVITVSPNGHDAEAHHLGPISPRGSGRSSSCRRAGGRPPPRWAPGRWSAAPWRPPSISPVSSSLPPTGGRHRALPAAEASMDIELVRACEERLVNVWPAVSTLLMDGWVVRFANGYSGRANSASAIVPGAAMDAGLLAAIERLYREAGLKPSVRVTPLAADGVEPLLLASGYRIKDQSAMLVRPLVGAGLAADPRIRIESAPGRAWLAGVSERQEPSKRSADHLFAIVGQLRIPAAFATLRIDRRPVGFGMAAIDRGFAEIGSVMLDAGFRGQGLGRALVDGLLAWAEEQGAERAFLQVDVTNTVARKLYASQGFAEVCGYKTMVRD